MRYLSAAVFGLMAVSAGAPALGQTNNTYNRLFLQVDAKETGGYRTLCFTSAADVANYFGVDDVDYTLAQEFFAGWNSPLQPQYCTARMPVDLIGRPHIYGADRWHSLPVIQGAEEITASRWMEAITAGA